MKKIIVMLFFIFGCGSMDIVGGHVVPSAQSMCDSFDCFVNEHEKMAGCHMENSMKYFNGFDCDVEIQFVDKDCTTNKAVCFVFSKVNIKCENVSRPPLPMATKARRLEDGSFEFATFSVWMKEGDKTWILKERGVPMTHKIPKEK